MRSAISAGPQARHDDPVCRRGARDLVAVEKTREFRGRYHVLQGAISPIDGVGPEQLRVRELVAGSRWKAWRDHPVHQPQYRGRRDRLVLASLFKHLPIRVTRIAAGSVGGDLEYADELTLGRALEGRRQLDG